MVRHGEIEPEKRDDGADEPLGLPQCQTEDRPHGQRRGDRQSRIMRLPAGRGAGFGPPCRDRHVGEPYHQTAPLSQGRVIFRPVGDPITRFGDMMTVLGVVFERHRGISGCLRGSRLRRSSPGRQPQLIRATTSRGASGVASDERRCMHTSVRVKQRDSALQFRQPPA
jgi:hypothetical protein